MLRRNPAKKPAASDNSSLFTNKCCTYFADLLGSAVIKLTLGKE